MRRYSGMADEEGLTRDSVRWYNDHRADIEFPGLNEYGEAASLSILAVYESTPSSVEALGALNRWPGRSGLPIEEYLRQWEASCAELKASSVLPEKWRTLLGVPRS